MIAEAKGGIDYMRICNLLGLDVTLTLERQGKIETHVLMAGEELCLKPYEKPDEDLIPNDSVDREPIVGGGMFPGFTRAKSKFDQAMMFDRETLLSCHGKKSSKWIIKLQKRISQNAETLRRQNRSPLKQLMSFKSATKTNK